VCLLLTDTKFVIVCFQAELQKYMVGNDTVDPIITEIVTTVGSCI